MNAKKKKKQNPAPEKPREDALQELQQASIDEEELKSVAGGMREAKPMPAMASYTNPPGW